MNVVIIICVGVCGEICDVFLNWLIKGWLMSSVVLIVYERFVIYVCNYKKFKNRM